MASSSSARVGDVRRESRATVQGKDEVEKKRNQNSVVGEKKKTYLWTILDCIVQICTRTATL